MGIGRFQTARLDVAPWDAARRAPGFAAELAAVATPATTAFLPPDLRLSDAAADRRAWADLLARGARVSTLRLRLRRDRGLAGLLILEVSAFAEGLVHLGYLFGRPVWGQGLGTELVRGAVAHLEGAGFAGRLQGGVAPDNPASAAVLRKAGFRRAGTTPDGAALYSVSIGG